VQLLLLHDPCWTPSRALPAQSPECCRDRLGNSALSSVSSSQFSASCGCNRIQLEVGRTKRDIQHAFLATAAPILVGFGAQSKCSGMVLEHISLYWGIPWRTYCRAGTDDYVAWNYTKTGVFSVRSAYHLKQHLKKMAAGRGSSSLNCSEHRGWLLLWAANVPGKAKVHCWRLVKNGLAVGDELRRRKKIK
jgi:hypothetical protein